MEDETLEKSAIYAWWQRLYHAYFQRRIHRSGLANSDTTQQKILQRENDDDDDDDGCQYNQNTNKACRRRKQNNEL